MLDLKVVSDGTSRHQVIQQALQLFQEGLAVGVTRIHRDSGKGLHRMVAWVVEAVDYCIEYIFLWFHVTCTIFLMLF